jgi:hypothetical protein
MKYDIRFQVQDHQTRRQVENIVGEIVPKENIMWDPVNDVECHFLINTETDLQYYTVLGVAKSLGYYLDLEETA